MWWASSSRLLPSCLPLLMIRVTLLSWTAIFILQYWSPVKCCGYLKWVKVPVSMHKIMQQIFVFLVVQMCQTLCKLAHEHFSQSAFTILNTHFFTKQFYRWPLNWNLSVVELAVTPLRADVGSPISAEEYPLPGMFGDVAMLWNPSEEFLHIKPDTFTWSAQTQVSSTA